MKNDYYRPIEGAREEILPGAIYLTKEAARIMRCSEDTIRDAVRLGRIKGEGRPLRVLGRELLKLAGCVR